LDASKYVKQALSLCPEINVIGIAGPGDTLASTHAIETFERIHADFPDKIMCLSTNGLMLEKNVDRLVRAGVQTISVTVNSVDPLILSKIVKYIIWDEQVYTGVKAAEILLGAQLRGIKRASEKGLLVKCNTVLIPNLNDRHIGEIAKTLSGVGASLLNIIPLIPQGDFDNYDTPSCAMLNLARKNAEKYLPVFRHCKHCRADACGIPGKNIEFSGILYGHQAVNTFSHG
jgi:nitrogen fixation protein NifB